MSMAAVAVRNQRKKQKGTPGGHTNAPTSQGGAGPGRVSRGPSLPTAQLAGGTALLVLELGALNQKKSSGFAQKASMADFDTSSSSGSSDSDEVTPKYKLKMSKNRNRTP